MFPKPSLKLHVEVVRSSESSASSKALHSALIECIKAHPELVIGGKLSVPSSLSNDVEAIQICDAELDSGDSLVEDARVYKAGDVLQTCSVKLKLHVFRLNRDGQQVEIMEGNQGEGDVVVGNCCELPCAEFAGLWDSLIFDSDIKERLLNYGRAMLSYSEKEVDGSIISSNRVILLHGPPGTGKTTLCKAIGQKLSIRLSGTFEYTIFFEINTHSLLSKYFSESGKLVTKMFSKIHQIIRDPRILVCILIDEVESLAHSRAHAASGVEPSDSFRVVNSVLTQLDLIKSKGNVLILATSNISSAIDVAFLDRADISEYIPNPTSEAIYQIIYSCLKELKRVELVTGSLPKRAPTSASFSCENNLEDSERLLIKLSNECSGMSGRSLRKLPLLAHAFYINPKSKVDVGTFIQAMLLVVRNKKDKLSPQEIKPSKSPLDE